MKTCSYCAAQMQDDAVTCTHCGRSVGIGRGLRASGEKLRVIGLGLALLIGVPILVLLLMAGRC